MCLPVSRLFWVSSLAYPNLLGTKGYVVVVVKRVTGKEDKTCTGETKPVQCKYVGTRQVLDKGVET
jgi:hypothetical protein